jgi:hypothetical protein
MHVTYNNNTLDLSDGFLAGIFGFLAAMWLLVVVILIVSIIAMWKIFEKAGREGWKSLIPFYNMYVLTEICGMTGWLFLLCFIPGIGTLIWTILIAIKLAPAFGKETAFAIGLILLPLIFELILAFGDAQYQLDGGAAKATAGSAKKTSTSTKKKTKDPWVEGK